ncbi:MAG: glutathione S-transferase N-terminal domain-containing protein [Bdellovibrionota bacterium]
MKLYYSVTSPFARKIRIAAMILDLDAEVELVNTDVYAKNDYFRINPLQKIPSLTTREGQTLTNSPFILEYLDFISLGKKILPLAGPERWPALNFQSIADGIMEASVLRRYESLRPADRQDMSFENRQKEKITNGLSFFETNHFQMTKNWGVAEISLACALGYLDLRFSKENWLKVYPHLSHWYQSVKESDVMKKTEAKI